MSESRWVSSQSLGAVVVSAFVLGLVGVALGFVNMRRVDDLALGMARVDLTSAAHARNSMDNQQAQLAELKAQVAKLEAELERARAADAKKGKKGD